MSEYIDEEEEKPKDVELFFDSRDGQYWFPIKGQFCRLGSRDIKMHLRVQGFKDNRWYKGIKHTDWPLYNAQQESQVAFAGPLAGRRRGLVKHGGKNYLVTDEAADIFDKVKKRDTKPVWFLNFIQELLPDEQWNHFLHWLRVALEAVRSGNFNPGQVVVLAGPPGCGKSLLQQIITEILGGRSANPFPFMTGKTNFNWSMGGAEHWAIEDPNSTTHIAKRREFGAALKEATVNRNYSLTQKSKDELLVPIFRRVTVSVNDETENLSVIPPFDGSIADKIFLFKCSPVDVGDDEPKTWATVMQEVPFIRSWVLHRLPKLPAVYKDNRFGVRAWHHPDLIEELSSMSPETRLLLIIDHILFESKDSDAFPAPWVGKSLDLERRLLDDKSLRWQVEKLLSFSSACGTYLARLAKLVPERINQRKRNGHSVWTIKCPQTNNTED